MNCIKIGDCRDTMRRWAQQGMKAQMCVTSPPYFGLRDYGHPGQIGLEPTPEAYIAAMVEVFRCVRDVLADDGTLWLNIGDSYNNFRSTMGPGQAVHGREKLNGKPAPDSRSRGIVGLKEKDLIGIPWMLAFALRADGWYLRQDIIWHKPNPMPESVRDRLRADGWYLRQDIIWHKPNPMPESVRDRCTKAHEYIFLLSKSERYLFDSEAMKEPVAASTVLRLTQDVDGQRGSDRVPGKTNGPMKAVGNGETRNRRSVWTVATQPYSGAHFATFPPALIEPCILAGSRPADIVLDPFMGSGTTAQVAQQLGRQYIGCELNPQYLSLQHERTAQQALMLEGA